MSVDLEILLHQHQIQSIPEVSMVVDIDTIIKVVVALLIFVLEECRTLHGCETGKAKITKAYKLPCEYVIHTVGPIWNGGNQNEKELLASCYLSSMQLALEHKIRKIAFPSISTGVYSFPVGLAARIAVNTVAGFLKEHPDDFDLVEWVLFDEHTELVYAIEVNAHNKGI